MKTITLMLTAALLALSASTASAWNYYDSSSWNQPRQIPQNIPRNIPCNLGNCW